MTAIRVFKFYAVVITHSKFARNNCDAMIEYVAPSIDKIIIHHAQKLAQHTTPILDNIHNKPIMSNCQVKTEENKVKPLFSVKNCQEYAKYGRK